VSEYIRFSDTKSAFLSVFYSAVFGFIVLEKKEIINTISILEGWLLCLYYFLIIGLFLTFLLGIVFLFFSVFPRLKNNFTDNSLFYFGSIAKTKFIDYSKKMEKLSEKESKEGIMEQIYTNSVIADKKMKNIQRSTKLLFALIVFVIVINLF
jgi:hypothetical protein